MTGYSEQEKKQMWERDHPGHKYPEPKPKKTKKASKKEEHI